MSNATDMTDLLRLAYLSQRTSGSGKCAPKARITCGGRIHPETCRLVWRLTSGSAGQPEGLEPRDKGRFCRQGDPAGRNASKAWEGLRRNWETRNAPQTPGRATRTA